jgi:class 3 adenylate cyclase
LALEQRRLAAIIAADVVGYSSLMGGMKAAHWLDFGNIVIIAWSLCWLASKARPKSVT